MNQKIEKEIYRYERKFNVIGLQAGQIENIIKKHPAMFSEIFQRRFINNIYFDDYNFSNFYQNLNGQAHRSKYRIRWYGDLFGKIDKPVLEIKMREGYVGKKPTYQIAPFEIYDNMPAEIISKAVIEANLPEDVVFPIRFQKPVLANRYSRKYFRTANHKFRITIDENLSYFRLGGLNLSFKHSFADVESVIMEIKYNVEDEDSVMAITSLFPFRITRNSKYANGVETLFLY